MPEPTAMADPIHLTSAANPRVRSLLKLREHRHRRATGLCLAEGVRETDRALAAGCEVVGLYLCPEQLGVGPDQLGQRLAHADRLGPRTALFCMTDTLLAKAAYRQQPEGLLAVVRQPVWDLHPDAPWLAPTDRAAGLWLVAVGLTKPGNLGALARTVSAAGAEGLLIADERADAFNPNAIRASTGAVFALPVVAAASDAIVAFLRARGVAIVQAVTGGTRSHHEADLTGPVALVVGAEDTGLDERWLGAARSAGPVDVTIPMPGAASGVVDSLNAATAAAVLVFETLRQRRADAPGRPDRA